jgi:hypothetical protein
VFAAHRKILNQDRLRLLDRFTMKDLAFCKDRRTNDGG